MIEQRSKSGDSGDADAEAGECEPFDAKAFEPAAQFYDRLASTCGTDIDLDAIIREGRKSHAG